jgi:threonine synthase
MNPYLLSFRCLTCGELHQPDAVTYTCPHDGGNLDAVFDYARIAREIAPATLARSDDRSIWRFAPLLPTPMPRGLPTPLTLLGDTPLYRAPRLENSLDVRAIWLKDDSRLPSSSFKDRASAMVVAQALASGRNTICVASTGNAAGALSALCAGTSLRAVVFVPEGTPEGKLAGITIHGATVYVVRGSYNDAVRMASDACERFGWYNRSTGTNPYTREGKKTAGFEIAEQLARHATTNPGQYFRAPDAVIVPLGDGNILSGVHKGFRELQQIGWIERMPRFIGVTAERAPSVARAFRSGVETFEDIASTTIASGISVDTPCDGVAALRAIRTSGGTILEASDEDMLTAMATLAQEAGVFVEPACAAAYVGLAAARRANLVRSSDEVVLQLTGSGFKDIRSAMRAAPQPKVISSLADIDDGRRTADDEQ